jgi:malate dehydrogenase (oxaloacetate-decarboxylating)
MDDWDVFPRVAVATALKAQEQGLARLTKTADELRREAVGIIQRARDMTRVLQEEGIVPLPDLSSRGTKPDH